MLRWALAALVLGSLSCASQRCPEPAKTAGEHREQDCKCKEDKLGKFDCVCPE